MSRVGKNPIILKDRASVSIADNIITVKGKKGEKLFSFSNLLCVEADANVVTVSIKGNPKNSTARALWGTTRAIISNMVIGVSDGFERKLDLIGVGYRATIKGRNLTLQLGYSHDVPYMIPEGVNITCPSPTSLVIEGNDKQQVGQVVAIIKKFRKADPYKGKGIRVPNAHVIRKEGKKK